MKDRVNILIDSALKEKMKKEAKKVNQSLTAWIISAAHFYMKQNRE